MNTKPEDPIMCRFLNEGATLVIDDSTGRVSIERDESNGPLLERIAYAMWKKDELDGEIDKYRSALFEAGMSAGDSKEVLCIVHNALKRRSEFFQPPVSVEDEVINLGRLSPCTHLQVDITRRNLS